MLTALAVGRTGVALAGEGGGAGGDLTADFYAHGSASRPRERSSQDHDRGEPSDHG